MDTIFNLGTSTNMPTTDQSMSRFSVQSSSSEALTADPPLTIRSGSFGIRASPLLVSRDQLHSELLHSSSSQAPGSSLWEALSELTAVLMFQGTALGVQSYVG